MKILTKYVLKETYQPFLVGLFFFTFGFIMELLPRVMNLIVNKGAPLKISLEIFFYMLPFNMAITIPMAVLMSSIISFNRLSGDNEVVAMKALSFPVLRIYKPIILFGFIMFVFSLFFNNIILPEANYRYRALTIYIVNIKPSMTVDAMRFMQIPDSRQYIGAQSINDDKLNNVLLYDLGDRNSTVYNVITARSGEWVDNDVNSSMITLRLSDGLIQEFGKVENISNTFTRFYDLDINIKRNVQLNVGGHDRGLREMHVWQIRKVIDNLELQRALANVKVTNDVLSTSYAQGSVDKNVDYQYFRTGLIEKIDYKDPKTDNITNVNFSEYKKIVLKENRAQIRELEKKNHEIVSPYYYLEYQKYFSIPATCFFVVLIGGPLGMVSKRSGKGGGFGVSLIVIAIYYGMLIASETIGRTGVINPAFAMWMPNLVLFLMGVSLIVRSIFKHGQ